MTGRFILLDTQTNTNDPALALDQRSGLLDAGSWHVRAQERVAGPERGVQTLSIGINGLEFLFSLTHGLSVVSGRCDGRFVGFDSPVSQLIHPALVDLHYKGNTGWHIGFNALLVRCGLEYNGPPVQDVGPDGGAWTTLHGRVGYLPATFAAVELEPPAIIRLIGSVYETAVFGPNYRLDVCYELDGLTRELRIRDKIGAVDTQTRNAFLIYHTNFSAPLLSADSRLLVPAWRIEGTDDAAEAEVDEATRLGPPQAGYSFRVFHCTPIADSAGRGHAMLYNPNESLAVDVSYDVETLPCFNLWKNLSARRDGYVVGLEPATNFANERPVERAAGRYAVIPRDGSYQTEVDMRFFTDTAAIDAHWGALQSLR